MQLYIDLALNDNYENASSLRRWCACCIVRSASRLRSVPALARSDILQPSACARPACMRSNLSCDVRALGEEMQRSSWRVRFVLREMRKYL